MSEGYSYFVLNVGWHWYGNFVVDYFLRIQISRPFFRLSSRVGIPRDSRIAVTLASLSQSSAYESYRSFRWIFSSWQIWFWRNGSHMTEAYSNCDLTREKYACCFSLIGHFPFPPFLFPFNSFTFLSFPTPFLFFHYVTLIQLLSITRSCSISF